MLNRKRKMLKNKKGQVFTADLAVATLIFMIILGVIFYLWTETVDDISSSETEYEMVWLSTAVSEQLVRIPGVPYNWTLNPGISNITVIGLADTQTVGQNTEPLDRVLDPNKMLFFINNSRDKYATVKNKLFGTGKYDYYIEFACLDAYTSDCFNNLHAEMFDVDNVTCDNGFAYYIQDHSTRVDRSLSGVWRLNEGRENRIRDGSGNNIDGQVYGALRASFNMDKSTDSYVYVDLVNVTNYQIQANDYLEYDVYWTSKDDKIAFDYTTTTPGVSLRNAGATDQNGTSADPKTDLSLYALNRWYHRKISITGHAGKIIQYYDIACESDDSATRLAYFDNIVITQGGVVQKVIWNGSSPASAIHPGMQVSGSVYQLDDYPAPPEVNSSGKYKYGLTLDGVDDYATVPDSQLKLGINQTIMAWVNVKGNSSDKVRIIGKGSNHVENYGLWRDVNGDLRFHIDGGSMGHNFNDTGLAGLNLPTNRCWIPLAATYDGHYGKIYINGSLVYVGTEDTKPYTSDDHLTIGYAGWGAYLNGSVDDVAVYNRTLGPDEIMNAYLHPKQVCVSGQNMSVNDTYYTIYDSKTATFSQSRDEEIKSIDNDVNILDPTMTLKVVIYQPAISGV